MYVSTVEPYLRREGSLPTFCASVATLPIDDESFFIRPGNAFQLSQVDAPAARATLPPVMPIDGSTIGTYQIGVIVPIKGGCG